MSPSNKFFIFTLIMIFLSACGGGSSDSATPDPTPPIIVPPTTITISGQVSDGSLTGASITVRDFENKTLVIGPTDAEGSFSLEVVETDVENGYSIETSGGELGGNAFTGMFKAIYSATENKNAANVTILTTLVSELTLLEDSGTLIERRDGVLQFLSGIGLFATDQWNTKEPTDVEMLALRADISSQGNFQIIDEFISDLQDEELSIENMLYFPMANGGIVQIVLNGSNNSRVLGNIDQTLTSQLDVLGFENAAYDFQIVDAPDGFSVSNDGLISFAVPASSVPRTDIEFIIKVLNSNTETGRSITGTIYPMPVTVVASQQLLPGIGIAEVSDPSGEIILKVPREALTDITTVEITKDIDDQGNPVSSIYIDTIINGEIEITVTDPEIISTSQNDQSQATNESKNKPINTSNNESTTTLNSDTYPLVNIWKQSENYSHFYKINCGIGLGNRIERRKFKVRIFEDCNQFNLLTLNLRAFLGSTFKLSSRLTSECQEFDTSCFGDKVPVIFVHGFIPSAEPISDDGLGGGDGTWGYFPQAIKSINPDVRVFEFQWVTAARFEDVAADLGAAITDIATKSGKKVHIIAHSFGGVLTRTYLQNLATDYSFNNDVASVTTVGSPHSGIFDTDREGDENAHGVDFKQGQDSQAQARAAFGISGVGQINLCAQITCYQMGEFVNFSQTDLSLYQLDFKDGSTSSVMDVQDDFLLEKKPGKFIAVLSNMTDSVYSLPENLPIQALIGLSTQRGDKSIVDEGDGLISYEGQRFSPKLSFPENAVPPLLNQSTSYGGSITEKILGLDFDSKPNVEYKTNKPLFPHALFYREESTYGYRHTGWPTGPRFATREVYISAPCGSFFYWKCWDSETHHTFLAARDWINSNPTEDFSFVPPPVTPPVTPSNPELPPNYIKFLEGNPGVEDDGIFVDASNISITDYSLTVEPKPLVGILENGVVITVVTELPTDQAFAQVYFEFGYLGSECLYIADDNDNVSNSRNNFEAAYYSPSGLEVVTENARAQSGCENINVSEMFLNRIEFLFFGLTSISIDAVIVERGPAVAEPPSGIYGSLTVSSANQADISFVPTSAFGTGSTSFIGQWNGPDNAFMQISLSSTSSLSLISFRPNFSIGTLICIDGNGEINANACSGVTINSATQTLTFLNVRMAVPTTGGTIYTLNGALLY
jgi:pimeloyl-ACP methyl ester carboxylesterase